MKALLFQAAAAQLAVESSSAIPGADGEILLPPSEMLVNDPERFFIGVVAALVAEGLRRLVNRLLGRRHDPWRDTLGSPKDRVP